MSASATPGRLAIVLLALLAASCGNSSDTPPPTPVPTPTSAPQPIAAMPLAVAGNLVGVNRREWIVVVRAAGGGNADPLGTVVLPPDAGPGAGPLPVPGCPLLDAPPGCTAQGTIMSVGETDWTYGQTIFITPSDFRVPIEEAFGPLGEVVDLAAFAAGDVVNDVRPGPGPIFIGTEPHFSAQLPAHRPVYWPAPGIARVPLPAGGFAAGPVPKQADAQQRIVGEGLDPVLPVLWLPGADGYALQLLALLDGGGQGGARGIDDGLIVGWSADASGSTHAVLWTLADAGVALQTLPVPVAAVSCTQAVGISGPRIAGECVAADGAVLAVVWARVDAATWTVAATLAPLPGDVAAHPVGISGDLVVGTSEHGVLPRANVAWRLP